MNLTIASVLQATVPHASTGGWSLADLLALAALVVGVVAIAFAMKQFVDAKHQTENLKVAITQMAAQTTRLEDIWKSIQTHYQGNFPDFLPKIIETLESAQESIVIFCDYPAYGRFSDPDNWLQYKNVIEEKAQDDVDVSLTCLNDERRRRYHRDQFSGIEKDWEHFKSNEEKRENLEHLFRHHKKAVDSSRTCVDDLTFDDFDNLMAAANQWMFNEVFAKMKTQPVELSGDMPLYFWLADGLRAVFAIPSLSEEATEYGFVTGDHKLITAFMTMRNRYVRAASKQ